MGELKQPNPQKSLDKNPRQDSAFLPGVQPVEEGVGLSLLMLLSVC